MNSLSRESRPEILEQCLVLCLVTAICIFQISTPSVRDLILISLILFFFTVAVRSVSSFVLFGYFIFSSIDFLPTDYKGIPIIPQILPAVIAVLCGLPFTGKAFFQSIFRFGKLESSPLLIFSAVTSFLSVGTLIIWAQRTDQLGIGIEMVKPFREIRLLGKICIILLFAALQCHC